MLTDKRRRNLERALNPRSVCYIGGSFLENTLRSNRAMGFDGDVWVVNPKLDTLADHPCFDTLDDLPGVPDAVFVAVNREMTNGLIPGLRDMGAGGAICYAAGYSEVGGIGHDLEADLKNAAGDLAVVGPNCYGVINYLHGVPLLAMPTGGERLDRGCAFIAQSGNLCINIANNDRSAPLAYVISCGNQSVLDISDYIDVLVDDPAITCFALFVEGIPDLARFSEVALRALEAGKPIIAMKSGVSALGAKMAMSHTASLAGDDELYQALFDQLGIIRVTTPVDLLETAKYITCTGVPQGRKLSVFTCSGGDNETVADLVEPLGIELPQPTKAQYDALRPHMQVFANITNPLDYNTTNWGNYDVLSQIFPIMLEGADAGLLVVDSGRTGAPDWGTSAVMEALRDSAKATDTPSAMTCVMPENSNVAQRKMMHDGGVAALQGIREGVLAVARTCLFGERRKNLMARESRDDLTLLPAGTLGGDISAMNEWNGKQALKAYGLPVPDGRPVSVANAAGAAEEIGFPVALKVLSQTILHKTDVGGVALNLKTPEEVAAAAKDMAARLGVTDVLVEPMAPKPVAEMIVGITRTDDFGPVLVVGAGGVLVELYKDAVSLLLPLHEDDVREAIERLKIAKLLDGFRGGPKGDKDALVAAVMAVARYAEANRESLSELDVNPLFVLPEGQGVMAVDALIRKTCATPC